MFSEPTSLHVICRYGDQTRQTQACELRGSSAKWTEGTGKVALVLPNAGGDSVDELHLKLCAESGEVVATRTMALSKTLGSGPQWQAMAPAGALLVDVSPPRQL
jgi:hypothetical protein